MKRLAAGLAAAFRLFRREDGTATIEFVLILPVFLTIFMASFETGLMMVRQTLLERALNITVRELMLGHFTSPTHDDIRDDICANAVMLPDCAASLKVSLERVSMTTWNLPTDEVVCRDRASTVNPPTRLDVTAPRELMLIRICARADAIFPTTGVAAGLEKDGQGGYRLIAMSAFVNEPW